MKFNRSLIFFLLIFVSCTAAKVSNKENKTEKIPSGVIENYLKSRLSLKYEDIDSSIKYLEKAIDYDGNSITFLRDLAGLYLRKDDKEKALSVVKKYYQKHPESAEALMILGRIKELLNHDFDSVTRTYEKVINLDKKKSAAYLFLGDLYYNRGKYKKADILYGKFIKVFPENFLGYYYLGKIAFAVKDYKKAVESLKKSVLLSNDVSSIFLLAKTYLALNEKDKAVKLYKKVLSIDPLNVKAVYDYSVLTKDMGNFHLVYLARNLSKRKILMDNLKGYVNKIKKYKESIDIIKAMAKHAGNKSQLYYFIAVLFERVKDSKNALKYYGKVRKKSDSYVKASISIASILQDQKNIKGSARVLEKVHRLIPENEEIILYLGIMYNLLEDYKKAVSILKKGLKLNEKNYSLHYRIGIVYDSMKQKKRMYKHMKRTIELKPDHANALNYLGYSYADSGINLDKAEELIKKALEIKPNDGYITDSLGWVYYKKGQYDKASTYIKLALEKVPNDPVVLEHLGDILLKLNEKKSALDYYEKALKNVKKDGVDKNKLLKKIKNLKRYKD